MLQRIWREDDGVLSFEWALLLTLLVLGLVSGLTAARDAFIDELGDISEALICIDQSYTIDGLPGGFIGSSYTDVKADYSDCDRVTP